MVTVTPLMVMVTPFSGSSSRSYTVPMTTPLFSGLADGVGTGVGVAEYVLE